MKYTLKLRFQNTRDHGQYLIYHLWNLILYQEVHLVFRLLYWYFSFLKCPLWQRTWSSEVSNLSCGVMNLPMLCIVQQDKTCRCTMRFFWSTERGLKFLAVKMLGAWSHRLLIILHISWILFPITKHLAIPDFFFTGGMQAFISFKSTYWWSKYTVPSLNCCISSSRYFLFLAVISRVFSPFQFCPEWKYNPSSDTLKLKSFWFFY